MAVREKAGRKRYILFKLEPANLSRKEFMKALGRCVESSIPEAGMEGLRLILLNRGTGILLCQHTRKEEMIAVLNNMHNVGINVQTLRTSGTIRKLKEAIEQVTCKHSLSGQ